MQNRALLIVVAAIPALSSCGSSSERTAYETLQNIGQQDCRKDPSATCPKREGYDDYQRQRRAPESK